MDGTRKRRLTAEPGTKEFLEQLLAIGEGSEHPMDKALTVVLKKLLKESEEGQQESDGNLTGI